MAVRNGADLAAAIRKQLERRNQHEACRLHQYELLTTVNLHDIDRLRLCDNESIELRQICF